MFSTNYAIPQRFGPTTAWDETIKIKRVILEQEFSVRKMMQALEILRFDKTDVPNRVQNEHLNSALGLTLCCIVLFSKFLHIEALPR